MSTASQINRLKTNVTAAFNSLKNGGVTVPSSANSDSLSSLIDQLTSEIIDYRTGSTEPSSNLGNDGDLYIKL